MARIIGVEASTGFFTYFARWDLAQVLDLCWRVGASIGDSRATSGRDEGDEEFIKSFCRGYKGDGFLEKSPLYSRGNN